MQSADCFGKQRLKDFYIDPTYINVNHGSYGLAPKVVLEHQRRLQEQCDHNTQRWFRVDSEKLVNEARTFIASQISCPPQNVYIVENATHAINALAKSLTWKEGDIVLIPNTAYACVRKTFYWLREHFNITILEINFTAKDLETPETFQLAVENFVNSYPKRIRLAVLDHIISVPGYVCPIAPLVEFFKEKGITFFIDGAHAINQEVVDMSELQPDAYFSNFHKWAYAPKSAAFLYLSDRYLKVVQPAVTGNFHGEGPARQFYWCGTRDFTAFLSIQKGIEYSQSFGYNAVREYNHSMAVEAARMIAEIWDTEVLTKDQRCIGYLANIKVPSTDIKQCVEIAYEMLDEDNCFPIFFKFDGQVYTRISAQIYNELSDYAFMAKKFLDHLERRKKGVKKAVLPQ